MLTQLIRLVAQVVYRITQFSTLPTQVIPLITQIINVMYILHRATQYLLIPRNSGYTACNEFFHLKAQVTRFVPQEVKRNIVSGHNFKNSFVI